MIEQLKELLEMQRVLDETILKENGNIYDEKIAEQNKVALFVELGELMNELQTNFKHWKKTAKDNRENALIEYADALHFALSLFNHYDFEVIEALHDYVFDDFVYRENQSLELFETLKDIVEACSSIDTMFDEPEMDLALMYLFKLGNLLGFTWEGIYKCYKNKNSVNHERQRKGY